ncbi:signal transduction histidine kinase [Actinoplanes lutulentus]|uniref:Signal transduction histidine kinase n=1 Tax=Actinoplanes lutulentus TaxID=1287878 RepID=A0A327ZIX7_9ACTN|nr:sensor histidine kinase [Actinoplanes lutulentus]MBB2942592.1 signal transduction histidine kinase [Actinoplanes lutulentus]RAK38173.1 signal transduction histidine kinase [Actinoplanes lutulentus]
MSLRLWDVYFLVVAAAVTAAIIIVDGFSFELRAGSIAAIATMAALHILVGRPLVRREAVGTAALLVCLTHLLLFGIAIACVPLATWLMFAVLPIFFMMVTLRRAIALVVVANVIPVLLELHADPGGIGIDLVIAAISTASGVCIGVWITRMIEQSNERADLIAELEASRAEQERLSHTAGVAAERNRLAGEIHDTLAQGFTSIITLVQAADPGLKDERLALAVRTARENLAESRALIAALSPAALASASLPEAVRRQAARFSEESSVPSTVRVAGEPRHLPTPVEVVLLRAVQEALTNVRRHAGAGEVAVLLSYAASSVRLVVRDDGCGFDPASSEGFGLAGMRARAAQVGGAVTVHGAEGTTIEVEIPA